MEDYKYIFIPSLFSFMLLLILSSVGSSYMLYYYNKNIVISPALQQNPVLVLKNKYYISLKDNVINGAYLYTNDAKPVLYKYNGTYFYLAVMNNMFYFTNYMANPYNNSNIINSQYINILARKDGTAKIQTLTNISELIKNEYIFEADGVYVENNVTKELRKLDITNFIYSL